MNNSQLNTCKMRRKSVNPKGNRSWIFIGRTDTEAEAPILLPPDAKNWLIRKHREAWKDWRQEEKGTTEDEMIEWHHQLDGHEFEQGLGVGNGQGSLVCCNPWGLKESDRTERLNWTELNCCQLWGLRGLYWRCHLQFLDTRHLWYTNLFGS